MACFKAVNSALPASAAFHVEVKRTLAIPLTTPVPADCALRAICMSHSADARHGGCPRPCSVAGARAIWGLRAASLTNGALESRAAIPPCQRQASWRRYGGLANAMTPRGPFGGPMRRTCATYNDTLQCNERIMQLDEHAPKREVRRYSEPVSSSRRAS